MTNKTNGQSTVITTPTGQGAPDGSSFAPAISSNGKFIVFHSHATNLVPGDTNDHVDIFRYEVFNGRLTRLSLGPTGEEGNGGSFYPVISDDGTKVAFESHANNLVSGQTATSGKQIFLWTESNGTAAGTGVVTAVTSGNEDSFDASISGDGKRIVFTTFADNLVVSEADTNKNSDVVLWENGQFHFAGRAEDGSLPVNGATREPVLSSNGEVISFVSSARNMVKGKGIAYVDIVNSGVGYPAGSTVQLTDANGSGASIRVSSLNAYGEIVAFSIDNPGRNYVNPTLTVLTPPGSSPPDRNVSAVPLLVNPEGDVFRITVSAVKAAGGSERISESPPLDGDPGSETGGKVGSREPSISRDGTDIAYSSRASNLLDLNVSSTNTKVFANKTFGVALAKAILVSPVRSITVISHGLDYDGSGILSIVDLSGSGSGATGHYNIDGSGRVFPYIITPGNNYDVSQTFVTIQGDKGTGFLARVSPEGSGENFSSGSTIHRIEMVDPGTGYPSSQNLLLEAPEIIIDGDGDDSTGDGKPDAKFNSDLLYIGSTGEVYIEQKIDVSIINRTSLAGSTLIIGDLNRTLTLGFDSTPSGPFVLGVDFIDSAGTIAQTDTGLRDTMISTIRSFWSNPTNLYGGPLFENNVTAGSGFTMRALNGTARTDNPSALRVSYQTNMDIGGSGYTRAIPLISPSPVISGFSEVNATVTRPSAIFTENPEVDFLVISRPIGTFTEDIETDDIYHYNHSSRRNSRVSLSKFGFPTNYLSSTRLPSHRYPSISGDGRYVFFSSDAGGLGGLIFGISNQNPLDADVPNPRSVYSVDLKSTKLPENNKDYVISVSTDLLAVTESTVYLGQPFPFMVTASAKKGWLQNVSLHVDGVQVLNPATVATGTRNHKTFFSWTPTRLGTHEVVASVTNNINEVIYSSPVQVEVVAPSSNTAFGNMIILPPGAAGQTTQGSSLLASVEFTGSNGKKAHVGSVAFYLNDQLLGTQTDPPFSTVFSPPAFEGNFSLSSWSLSAVAKDLNGSTFITSRSGQIQGSTVLPTLTLSPINSIAGISSIFDKQRVTLQASATGDSDVLALVQRVHFLANGLMLGANIPGVPIINSSGQITSIEYQFEWDVDFARYAKPGGNVEIVVLGEMNPVGGATPVFASSSQGGEVSPPTPWLDDKSTALSIFSDLSESNMSTRQVESLLETINAGGQDILETWVNELSEVASFQQKMSIIGAHQICMGEWHDSFISLETDFNNFIPTGAVNTNWLKTYVDHVLNSDQYISKYGVVDYLVGYENEKDIHDFDQNRRAFAEQCLFNKYGSTPSFQQMFQGSKRMVYFYYNLAGNSYWEVRTQQQNNNQGGGGGNQATQFSPPRLDSLTNNAYVAGECAVEFVAKLTEEVPIDGIPYIVYTESLRKSTYKVATLAQLLWREKADPIQNTDIQRLAAMPITLAIKSILNDYRYTSRFNLIWKESEVVDVNTPSWKKEDWFGYFWDRHFPWIYHEKLGWIYIAGVSPTQFWFHHATLGWLWTGAAHYPSVYSNSEQNWIYFSTTSSVYYSHGSQAWKTY